MYLLRNKRDESKHSLGVETALDLEIGPRNSKNHRREYAGWKIRICK